MSAALRILAPGLMTTVQDLGRIGYQRLGIPGGGALDALSLRAANLLVGNAPDVGGLEIIARVTLSGCHCFVCQGRITASLHPHPQRRKKAAESSNEPRARPGRARAW
jgi:hypothetical protein